MMRSSYALTKRKRGLSGLRMDYGVLHCTIPLVSVHHHIGYSSHRPSSQIRFWLAFRFRWYPVHVGTCWFGVVLIVLGASVYLTGPIRGYIARQEKLMPIILTPVIVIMNWYLRRR